VLYKKSRQRRDETSVEARFVGFKTLKHFYQVLNHERTNPQNVLDLYAVARFIKRMQNCYS
jgi:hypothetical protein